MTARKKVVILGGGVAGMSAAHELVERGFEVEVFEGRKIPGGKARSLDARPDSGLMRVPTSDKATRWAGPPLPAEHGFRFFPGFYRHVVDTMARIPYPGGSVADNLVDTSEFMLAAFDRPPHTLPSESPRAPGDVKVALFGAVAVLSGRIGVSADDSTFFAGKLWEMVTSCEERRLVELELISWWDFIEASSRSAAYQKFYGNGITRSLVAAKAQRASAKTIGNIFLQIVFDIATRPEIAADRVLNGPTNDVWLAPWLTYLKARGASWHFDAKVVALHAQAGRLASARIRLGNVVREVTADFFVAALPVERMRELVSPSLEQLDGSLRQLHALTEYVEWMNGIQYYLTEDLPLAHGHQVYIDSPWALTSVSQPQFWPNYELSQRGDGQVRGLLSVDISDWDVPGLNGKQARHCSREEIALETWEQLKRSLNVGGERLRDSQLHSWFLDPGIDDTDADANPFTPRIITNAEPLLVNYVNTWRLRPDAVTRIPNLFLASDYVRTFTDLATMEAANEAARRAVNGILRAAQLDLEPCAVWNLNEPEVFVPFRAYDRVRYRRGLGWGGEAMELSRSAFTLASAVARATPSPEPTAHATPQLAKQEQVAETARASSDSGLRRIRILEAAP